jgi:Yip1 domain
MNAVLRMVGALFDPAAEWQWIEKEPGDAIYLLAYYVAPLAILPAICGFIGGCIIGAVVPGVGTVHLPIFDGLLGAIFGYAASFVVVLLVALWIAALAPRFGGRRDFAAALKLAVYSFTPVWLTGLALILPGLHFLELTGLYGAYLLVKGLPVLMKVPEQRSQSYAAAIVAFAAVLILATAVAQRALFGPGAI